MDVAAAVHFGGAAPRGDRRLDHRLAIPFVRLLHLGTTRRLATEEEDPFLFRFRLNLAVVLTVALLTLDRRRLHVQEMLPVHF